ncbi:hypothetical protein JCM10213v2_005960 [Rhodosporidiobolus nylandii]
MSYNNQYPQQPQQAYHGQFGGPGGDKGPQQYGYGGGGYGQPQGQAQGYYGPPQGMHGQQPMYGQQPYGQQPQMVYVQPNQPQSGPGAGGCCAGLYILTVFNFASYATGRRGIGMLYVPRCCLDMLF